MKITIEQMFVIVGFEIFTTAFIINVITNSAHHFSNGGAVFNSSNGFVFAMNWMCIYGIFAFFYFLSKLGEKK